MVYNVLGCILKCKIISVENKCEPLIEFCDNDVIEHLTWYQV
jgi:hypothetical protein